VEAAFLQAATFRDGFSQPLPLVAVNETDGAAAVHCWSGITPGSLVFWDPADPLRAIRAALRVGGQVGAPISFERAGYHGETLLNHVYRTRDTAIVALARQLEALSPHEAADLFRTMPLVPAQAAELSRTLSPELKANLELVSSGKVFVVGKRLVRESADGWDDARTGKRIVNGIVRVTELVTHPYGRRVAVGTVLIGGNSYSFRLLVDELETKGLFTALRTDLRRQNGPELMFDKRWDQHSWEAVLEISKPSRTQTFGRVGWNAVVQRLVLPSGKIGPTGFEPAADHTGVDDEGPLANWTCIGDLDSDRDMLKSLSPAEATIFWAIAVLVAERFLAPVANSPERGILVTGDAAQEYVLGMVPAMGLLSPRYPSRRSADDQVEWLSTQVDQHNVPPILNLREARGQAGVARWLEALGNHAALLLVPEICALSAQTQRRFHVLRLPQNWRAARDWRPPECLPTGLIIRWLIDLSWRGFQMSNRRTSPLERLLHDLSNWASRSLGNDASLGKLDWALVSADRIDPKGALDCVIRLPDVSKVLENEMPSGDKQFLDRSRLDQTLARLKCPRIDWKSITDSYGEGRNSEVLRADG